jgi:glucuronokinase
MIDTARGCGASAIFAGSGGAIVGLYPDEAALANLRAQLGEIGSRVIIPQIVGNEMTG